MDLELWGGEPVEIDKDSAQENALIDNCSRTSGVGDNCPLPSPKEFPRLSRVSNKVQDILFPLLKQGLCLLQMRRALSWKMSCFWAITF